MIGRQSQLTGRARLRGLSTETQQAARELDHERHRFEAMQGGPRPVVQAHQHFPTPPAVAAQVARLAMEGARTTGTLRVLEPSAGTGNLIKPLAVYDRLQIVAVEIVPQLADRLRQLDGVEVHCRDFLRCNGELGEFDLIVMNPPFERGADIKHIQHARTMLNQFGRLVAVCADTNRRRNALEPDCVAWHRLPAGSFKASGTDVATAIVVYEATP